MTVDQVIVNPTATIVVLAEVTAGAWMRAWCNDATYTTTYRAPLSFSNADGTMLSHTVTGVKADGVSMTQRASASALDAAADGWFYDGDFLWVKHSGGTPFSKTWMACVKFYFGDTEKTLNDTYWEPRLKSAPAISQRIEAVFGKVGQVGGGTLTLINNDGFFSELNSLIWDFGEVTLRLGVDTTSAMAWADYEVLATWRVEQWRDNRDGFELQLVEPKARVKAKLPLDVFSRDDYPNIDDDNVGKPIPIAYGQLYGVEPVVINPGTKTFKVAGHAIRGFDGVRLKKNRAELVTRTTASGDWLEMSANVRRYYIAGETVKTVTFAGVALTEVNDVDDVTSTASRWAYVENYIYVRPQAGKSWDSGSETIVIESEQTSDAMVVANFASVDPANGEFTLGDDWAVGTDVAVDFRGKIDGSGFYIENAVDIVEDLLTTAGETNLNSASFATARAHLIIGTDENGNEVNIMRPSLYMTDAVEIVEVIETVMMLARGYVYSDQNGEYSIGIFRPTPGENCATIDDTEIFSLEKRFDAGDLVTKLVAKYQDRPVDGYAQSEIVEFNEYQYVHDQPSAVISEQELPTAYIVDAQYWSQSSIFLLGKPLAKHNLTVPWKHMRLLPGDQVWIQSDRHGIDDVFEVLEKKLDLESKHVALVVGNLRSFEDTPGFLVSGSAVLPTRFASLTGYSAGALTWNANWADEIRTWARQNVGYWTDANGFATATDHESFIPSAWT